MLKHLCYDKRKVVGNELMKTCYFTNNVMDYYDSAATKELATCFTLLLGPGKKLGSNVKN